MRRRCRILALTLLASGWAQSAVLTQQTLNAWNAYIAHENSQVKERAATPLSFFWVDQVPGGFQQVHDGAVLTATAAVKNPIHVPGGLIHHWISAEFIPEATVDDVLAVTRDYVHYKDYYKPGVADVSVMMKSEFQDEFTIRFVNSSMPSTTSLLGTYVSQFVEVSPGRWYSKSETTSMCEFKNYGCANQKELPPNEGSGYVWRLYSTARMEDRDGGVLLEMEAVALSREIPIALHWLVDPIVRRLSRDSIQKSLSDTAAAVRGRVRACAQGKRIIESGPCLPHADNSDLRAEKLAGDPRR